MVPFAFVFWSRRVASTPLINPGSTVLEPDLSLLATAPNTRSRPATATVAPVLTAVPTPISQDAPINSFGRDHSKYSAMAARVGPDVPETVTMVAPGTALRLY